MLAQLVQVAKHAVYLEASLCTVVAGFFHTRTSAHNPPRRRPQNRTLYVVALCMHCELQSQWQEYAEGASARLCTNNYQCNPRGSASSQDMKHNQVQITLDRHTREHIRPRRVETQLCNFGSHNTSTWLPLCSLWVLLRFARTQHQRNRAEHVSHPSCLNVATKLPNGCDTRKRALRCGLRGCYQVDANVHKLRLVKGAINRGHETLH